MATSRLANILQQEYKTKGLIGGAASSLGKRSLEKLDIRNALFSGGGIGSIIGTKIFGKGYSATRNNTASNASQKTSPSSLTSDSSSILQDINTNSKITAKNSMALPAMAKQMNIMQKNIAKLVTVSGGTPTKKADSFFSSSKFRENQYEAQFNKGTKPTKVEEKEKSSGGFLSMLSSLASGIMSVISSVVSAIGKSIGSLSGLFTGLGIAVAGISVAFSRVLGFLVKSPIGRLLGLAGIAVAATKAMAGTTKTPGEAGTSTNESNTSGLNQSVIDTAAGVGGAIAATGIIGGASKLLTAGSQTKTAILDAKTTPPNISYKDKTPTTKWGKFLAFVERKAPTLFAKFGARLAAAGALATIPVLGWITALIQFGFSIYTAYEIYQLWKEYSNQDTDSKSPVNVSNSGDSGGIDYGSAADAMSGSTTAAPIMTPSSPSTKPSSSASSSATSSSTTPTKSSLLDLIASGESGKAGYDAANKGKSGDMPGGYPGLSKMTVNDVMRLQSEGKVFATGRYQIIPKTLAGLMSGAYGNTGVKGDDLYDASTQDKLGTALINKRLQQGGGDPIKTQLALSQEFASIADPSTGKSYYEGKGNNKASISTEQIQASLSGTGTKINGSVLASASGARETASMSQSAFSSADMADILSVIGGSKTSGSSSGSGMNQVVSTSKSTPYHSDFYSNLVRTQAL
jgi:hypothetical protein